MSSTEMTGNETALVDRLLAEHIYWLRNQIREQDLLSQPCPPGHWRWADVNTSGYGHKSEPELAADRQRAAERAAGYRAELAIALSAKAAPPPEPMHSAEWTDTDIATMRTSLRHAADHLDEVRDDIAGPYHAGDSAPAEVISQLVPTLNTLAEYVREVRAALIVMAGGGLRDDGKGDWMVGAAGPYDEMADALAARTINEINEFVMQGPED